MSGGPSKFLPSEPVQSAPGTPAPPAREFSQTVPTVFEDMHDPAASAYYDRGDGNIDSKTMREVVAEELAADPNLGAHVVFVAPRQPDELHGGYPSALLPPHMDAMSAFHEAVAQTNARRAEMGLASLPDGAKRELAESMGEMLAKGSEAFAGSATVDDVPYTVVYLSPDMAEDRFEAGVALPPEVRAGLDMRRSIVGSHFIALHEVVHAATYQHVGSIPDVQAEGIADSVTLETTAERGHPDIGEEGRLMAAWRSMQVRHPGHALAADAVLQTRHDLLSAAERKGARASVNISEKESRMISGTIIPEDIDKAVIDYGQAQRAVSFAQGVLSGGAPEIPSDLRRDAAVALLRTQMALDEYSEVGPTNRLTRIMPDVWEKNPKAFAEAQEYFEEEYGIKVHSPHRMEQGIESGRAAHEASRLAGKSPEQVQGEASGAAANRASRSVGRPQGPGI